METENEETLDIETEEIESEEIESKETAKVQSLLQQPGPPWPKQCIPSTLHQSSKDAAAAAESRKIIRNQFQDNSVQSLGRNHFYPL